MGEKVAAAGALRVQAATPVWISPQRAAQVEHLHFQIIDQPGATQFGCRQDHFWLIGVIGQG